MKLSIIVPVYQAGKYLEKCIKSILDQTFTDFELILVMMDQTMAAKKYVMIMRKKMPG